jgi:hypothetical protein
MALRFLAFLFVRARPDNERPPSMIVNSPVASPDGWPSRSSPKVSEGWLAVRDDFRNWLIREAA